MKSICVIGNVGNEIQPTDLVFSKGNFDAITEARIIIHKVFEIDDVGGLRNNNFFVKRFNSRHTPIVQFVFGTHIKVVESVIQHRNIQQ